MLKLVFFLATVSVAFAAVAIYPAEDKPVDFDDQPGCYFSKFKRVLPYNVYFYPNTECSRYLCQSDNTTQQETCGAVGVRDGCRLSDVDNSKQYPACCGTKVCDATTTQAPTTTSTTEAPWSSYAYASAESRGGQPPKTVEYVSGPDAYADATAD